MADSVRWATVIAPDGSLQRLGPGDLGFGYRTSAIKRAVGKARPMVLEVALALAPGSAEELSRKAAMLAEQRHARTPEGCCAGSIFQRTAQYPAGFLIEQAGLKGLRVGGAVVSPKHANFMMNTGSATARDVRELIERVQQRVFDAFALRLEVEIEFVGQWSGA